MPLLAYLNPDAVRQAIDATLTIARLPNELIESDLYGNAAIAEIKRRVPNADDITDATKVLNLKNAVNLLTAALIIPVVPFVFKQQTAEGDSYQRSEIKPDELIAKLLGRVDGLIDGVLDPEEQESDLPVFFGLARGRRGC